MLDNLHSSIKKEVTERESLRNKLVVRRQEVDDGKESADIKSKVFNFCDRIRETIRQDREDMEAAFEDTLKLGRRFDRIAIKMKGIFGLILRSNRENPGTGHQIGILLDKKGML